MSSFQLLLLPSKFVLGSPEIGPGELIGGSTTSTGLGPTGTNTGSSPNPTNFPATTTPSPLSPAASSLSASSSSSTSSPSKGSSSNTGAIVGGTVGGVAVIAVAAVVAVFLRRSRSRAPSAAYVVDNPPVAPQPRYGSQNPLSDDGTNVSSMIASETPTTPMRLYVIVPVPSLRPYMLMCCLCMHRTRTTQPRSRVTKVRVRVYQTPLPSRPSHRIVQPTQRLTCRPRTYKDIAACRLSNFLRIFYS